MEKKNTGLIILVIILSLLVIGLGGYIVYDKVLNKDSNTSDIGTDNGNTNVGNEGEVTNYSFGDEVIISKMASIKDYYGTGDVQDFSKWNVLSTDENTVTLYSANTWGKDYKIGDHKNIFEKNGVTINEFRGLNEKELELLGCDILSLTCTNTPSWAKTSLTSVVSEKSIILFEENKLSTIPFDGTVLVPIRPVVVIAKDNL